MFLRTLPATLLAAVIAIGVAGCKGKNENTPVALGTKNQILHLGNGTEPSDLDPHTVTGVPEHHILAALFEGLIGEDPNDLSPVPACAERWEISKDGKTYTFYLQKDGKWSNGDPLTAKDFVYSWQRVLSPALASEYSYMLHYVKNAKEFNQGKIKDFSKVGIKATDDHTLKVTLNNSTPFFLRLLQHYSTWPVHKATVEKFGKMDERGTKWTRAGNMVSNGPFKLKTWEINKVVVADRNPNYWDAKTVRLNEIHFYPTENSTTEERSFRAGDLHKTNVVPIEKIAVYKKKNPELLRIEPYLGTYYYRFNTTKKPFNDARVRRAFSMTIDREKIVSRVTKSGEIAANVYTPPGTGGYTASSKYAIEENVEKAKQLLADAGYPGGKGFPTVSILYNTLEQHKKIAEAIQQMWKKNLGVNITLSNQDWKVYLNSQKKLDYDMSRAGWIGDYPDPNTFLDMFVTGGGNNQTGWSNKQYDALIAKAGRTKDQTARFAVFDQAEEILMTESPIMPIYTYTSKYLISPDVKNWNPTILDHHPYKHVYLEQSGGVKLSAND